MSSTTVSEGCPRGKYRAPSIKIIKITKALEAVCVETVESGIMTKDLAVCVHGNKVSHGEHYVYTEEFLDALDKNLQKKLA